MTQMQFPALFRASGGTAIRFAVAFPGENDQLHYSHDGTDFGPVKIIGSGWLGPNNDEQKLTFVEVPADGYHADEYLPGAPRLVLERKLDATTITINGETYEYDPGANAAKLTFRQAPTVHYNGDAYRALFNKVRETGLLQLGGLLGTDYRDCWPECNVDRGDRVRGEYLLVTADPRYRKGVLDTLSAQLGRPAAFATTYELMEYAIKRWDQRTKIVCAGTRVRLARPSDLAYTDPAYFCLAPTDSPTTFGSISAVPIHKLWPSQVLCVIVES